MTNPTVTPEATHYTTTGEWEPASNDIGSVLEEIVFGCNQENLPLPETITITSGYLTLCKASRFVPDLEDFMSERAYEDVGEFTEGWLDGMDMDALQGAVERLIDARFEEAGQQPSFGEITEIETFKVRITSVPEEDSLEDIEWERVDDDK